MELCEMTESPVTQTGEYSAESPLSYSRSQDYAWLNNYQPLSLSYTQF